MNIKQVDGKYLITTGRGKDRQSHLYDTEADVMFAVAQHFQFKLMIELTDELDRESRWNGVKWQKKTESQKP